MLSRAWRSSARLRGAQRGPQCCNVSRTAGGAVSRAYWFNAAGASPAAQLHLRLADVGAASLLRSCLLTDSTLACGRASRLTFRSAPTMTRVARISGTPRRSARKWKRRDSRSDSLITRWYLQAKELLRQMKVGLRLMMHDLRLAWGLLWQAVEGGGKLTPRERRHLARTAFDMVKVAPFAVALVLPGGSVLLPIVIKWAPGLLPSSFAQELLRAGGDALQTDEMKRRVSKHLQARLHELASGLHTLHISEKMIVDDLSRFGARFRRSGAPQVTNTNRYSAEQQLLWMSKNVSNEMLLDSLQTELLRDMAKTLGIRSSGIPRAMLVFQLNRRFKQVEMEDGLLARSVTSLGPEEMKEACHMRGIQTQPSSLPSDDDGELDGVQQSLIASAMSESLRMWTDLTVNHRVPVGLLVYSEVFRRDDWRLPSDCVRPTSDKHSPLTSSRDE